MANSKSRLRSWVSPLLSLRLVKLKVIRLAAGEPGSRDLESDAGAGLT